MLAAHLLDLVPGRPAAIHELRRVLAAGGTCVAVTNGPQHLRAYKLVTPVRSRLQVITTHLEEGSA